MKCSVRKGFVLKKILGCFVCFLTVFLSACQNTTSTESTIQMNTQTTTTTTEYRNVYYDELNSRIQNTNFLEADFLDVVSETNINTNVSGFRNVEMVNHTQLDNVLHTVYTSTGSDFLDMENYSFTYYKGTEYYQISVNDSVAYYQNLEVSDNNQFDLLNTSDLSVLYSTFFNESIHVTKTSENTYYTKIPLFLLVNQMDSLYEGITDLQEMDLVDLENVFVNVTFTFIDSYTLYIYVLIDDLVITTDVLTVYVGVRLSQTYSVDPNIEKEVLDLSQLTVFGTESIMDHTFVFHKEINSNLRLAGRSENYFKIYLESGDYRISFPNDDDLSLLIHILNEDLTYISSDHSNFTVVEEGYYYINFVNRSEIDVLTRVILNKEG